MNKDKLSKNSLDEQAKQADQWFAMLHSPLFDRRQRRALRHWLAENPANQIALQKSQAFWQKMGALNPTQIALLEHRLATVTPTHQAKAKPFFGNVWVMPTLACCLLLLVSAGAFWQSYFADYRTTTGEQRLIQLGDGSSVLLNTASALSVNFSPQRRSATLHGGEAHFKVAQDPRPFEVVTKSGTVRALGTAFDVKLWQGNLTVTVDQHAVRVTFRHGATVGHLGEGEQVSLIGQQVSPITTVNLRQAMAWQQRRLVFKDQPLQQVVAELSRYRGGAIVITDPTLAQHHVTGAFDSGDSETTLHTIEKSLQLREYRLTNKLVLLAR